MALYELTEEDRQEVEKHIPRDSGVTCCACGMRWPCITRRFADTCELIMIIERQEKSWR